MRPIASDGVLDHFVLRRTTWLVPGAEHVVRLEFLYGRVDEFPVRLAMLRGSLWFRFNSVLVEDFAYSPPKG